jgi:two-component system, OmpR family, sensor kinase
MTLRARLTIALVALVGVGLIVADVATYAALRSFLYQRLDQQLRPAPGFALAQLASEHPGDFQGPPGPQDGILPSGTYAALFDPSGGVVAEKLFVYGGVTPALPALPSAVTTGAGPGEPFTVGCVGGGSLHYRVVASGLGGSLEGYTVVVAIPLTETTQTLQRLAVIAGLVTLAVLAAMAFLSWWTVRRELHPLEEIEVTAGAIAAGDLSQRVEETDPRTEVGRLGVSLNVMLERIEEAMDERKASEEALRRFLADASHELRTPLTSIRGYAELFRRGASASPQDTALAMRRIEQESERMGLLVGDLLFLARAGQGRPIAHEPVDLVRVASDAVQDARVADPTRDIDLAMPEALTIDGDEPRVRQILANLLSNALVHTPAGSPVSVRLSSAGDGWVEVAVSDRGPGLSTAEIDRVFDPFYRADPARARSLGDEDGGGTGLGLAIVAAIAEAHGGSVGVVSLPGDGATFTVRLPVASERTAALADVSTVDESAER